jgi:hypothetical protein
MCHGFELELWLRAVEQSRRKTELEELKQQAGNAAVPRPPEPKDHVVQPDPVPA